MRVLHLACMPFPSPQGTQAAVHAMLGALAAAREASELLVYGSGAEGARCAYPVHRLPSLPFGRSLRSGPSVGKVALDAAMVARAAALYDRIGAGLVIAHNVEAALVAAAARRPFAYFAHTAMDVELPFYARPSLGRAAAVLGSTLDSIACQQARAVASISPSLADHLRRRRGVD
ncbi:MAG: glycosyltransferase, partial [Polyangiaceae bacterium]|nr:glycosyltransferase [Polyangiaceae bacterium]